MESYCFIYVSVPINELLTGFGSLLKWVAACLCCNKDRRQIFQPPVVPPNPDIIDEFFSSDCLVDWPRHWGYEITQTRGKKNKTVGSKTLRQTYVWVAGSAFCLGEGCRSSISSFSSLPFPCRGKNESLSQQLASVIPQYRPGFHSCRGTALWHHFPLTLLWWCSLPVGKGSLMIVSRKIRLLFVFLLVCRFTKNGCWC